MMLKRDISGQLVLVTILENVFIQIKCFYSNRVVVVKYAEGRIVQWKFKRMSRKWGKAKSESRERGYRFHRPIHTILATNGEVFLIFLWKR